MTTITLDQFHERMSAQKPDSKEGICFVCPMCGTIQNGRDLIAAGAGKTWAEVEKYLGFSCVGRFTHGKPPPAAKDRGTQCGCNWTLGGLFQTHDLEVILGDGTHQKSFEIATPEQAKEHNEKPA